MLIDVRIVKNGVSSRIELSTPTFKFKDFEEVYFHAQVKACKNSDCVSFLGHFMNPFKNYKYELTRSQVICDVENNFNFDDFLQTRTDVLSRLRRSSLTDPQIMTIGPLRYKNSITKPPVFPGNELKATYRNSAAFSICFLLSRLELPPSLLPITYIT